MEEIDNNLKFIINPEQEEYFYGNNYINNLNNILINKKQKIKISNQKEQNNTHKEFENNLNIICKIYPETITHLFYNIQGENKLYTDKIGQIDFNSIIIRKYNPQLNENNILFYNKYFEILSKVVYPSIQIFYDILSNKEKDNNNNNIEIVLEYIPSDFEEVQTFISKCLNGNSINYLIITKISEVLSYIYECGYSYLMLYPSNIKFNNKLFKQYFKVNEDSNFLYAINKDYFSNPSKIFNNNFMKIINLGTYLKYKYLNDRNYYSLKNESLKDLSFLSPEFFEFISNEKINSFPDDILILEKWDIYSFGCLLFYIFFQKYPYFFIIDDNNVNDEIKLKNLINVKIKEKNFLETHINNMKEKINDIPDDIINLINKCTCNQNELRPSFNEVLNYLNDKIKPLIKDNNNINNSNNKDIFHDYSFYQLSKYNDDLILKKEILKNQTFKKELEDVNNEYNIKIKESFLNNMNQNIQLNSK